MRRGALVGVAVLAVAMPTSAAPNLTIVSVALDPPTVMNLGVQMIIADDDNANATVTVRYRKQGDTAWRDGAPLFRVRPAIVVGRTVPKQFAGSIFDLAPATTYEIELHAVDPDGLDTTKSLTGTTRAIPTDPKTPNVVNVSTAAQLTTALNVAKAGDVITLAKATYAGQFSINASGTADNPIVIRGVATDDAVLDGGGGTGNVLEVYGSHIHVERLTIQNLDRALRFQTQGTQANVVRRIHTKNTRLGIGTQPNQKDFYICDNILEGRLAWPAVYTDNAGANANDDGINVQGNGHVVCHNRLVGFGDAMKSEQDGARSVDFYGNETLSAYDNAIELDGSEGNTRAMRNRFINAFMPLSYQPIYGGPAYAIRNIGINIVSEQNKLHSLGGTNETVGAVIWNNTFVSYQFAMVVSAAATAHDFSLENNIFVGPTVVTRTVDFSAPIDNATIDFNGYYPDGRFDFGSTGDWTSFSAMKTANIIEKNGVLLDAQTFITGIVGPVDYKPVQASGDVSLANASKAIDKARIIPNVTDSFKGAGPDLGALENGCPSPIYGPRPDGTDESNEPLGCTNTTTPPNNDGGPTTGDGGPLPDGASPDGGTTIPGQDGGCGCSAAPSEGGIWAALALALALLRSSSRGSSRSPAARRYPRNIR